MLARDSPVLVVEAHDVVLAEVVAALHFEHRQQAGAAIRESMLRADGNIGRLVDRERERVETDRKERDKAEGLARDLTAARRESEAQAAASKKAADRTAETQQLTEVQRALKQERDKAVKAKEARMAAAKKQASRKAAKAEKAEAKKTVKPAR